MLFKNLLEQGRIKEAIAILEKAVKGDRYLENDVMMQKASFSRIERENRMGVMSRDEYKLSLNRMNQGLLYIYDRLDSPPKLEITSVSSTGSTISLFDNLDDLSKGLRDLIKQYSGDREVKQSFINIRKKIREYNDDADLSDDLYFDEENAERVQAILKEGNDLICSIQSGKRESQHNNKKDDIRQAYKLVKKPEKTSIADFKKALLLSSPYIQDAKTMESQFETIKAKAKIQPRWLEKKVEELKTAIYNNR